MKKDTKFLCITGIITIILILGLFGSYLGYYNYKNSLKAIPPEAGPPLAENTALYQRKIDGAMIDDSAKTDLYPVGVIIENNYEAWPLYGIDKAKIVYEFEAEASIPRLLAVFTLDEKIEKIGPVRSVRPYFIDINEGYGALLAHCGGSPEALAKIKEYGVEDLNEFYYGSYFWRDDARSAPHNIFTSTDLLEKALEKRELKGLTKYNTWQYLDNKAQEGEEGLAGQEDKGAENISIDFKAPIYKAGWKYNKEKNAYQRFQDSTPVLTGDNQEVWAKNVIVVEMKRQILDDIGRRKFGTIGSGKALIFTAGKVIEGKWEKGERQSRERFIDDAGNEIKIGRGNTWIEVARSMEIVQY